MALLRKTILVLLAMVAVIGFLIFGLFAMPQTEQIAKNRKIEQEFIQVAKFVDDFLLKNKRLPTDQVLADNFKNNRNTIRINLSITDFPSDLEPIPENSYYLSFWRGEWEEFYTPWNGKSTLVFDESAYYPFHSKFLTYLVLLSMACFIGACIYFFRKI